MGLDRRFTSHSEGFPLALLRSNEPGLVLVLLVLLGGVTRSGETQSP